MIKRDIKTSKGNAILYKGYSKGETPKTYKKIDVLRHDMGNDYNSSLLTLYKAQDGTLRYEIYRDGNFYPYYGKIEFQSI